MNKKKFYFYVRILGKRIYKPIEPLASLLLKKMKLWQVLVVLVILEILGSLSNGWRVKPQEKAAWWPWLSQAHSQMAVAWFEAGNEEKALRELALANKLLIIKSGVNQENLRLIHDKISESKKIRREIFGWEEVLEKNPYYKDVLLRLSILNYQLYQNEKAKDYFERAEYLDPNDDEVLEVGKIIL